MTQRRQICPWPARLPGICLLLCTVMLLVACARQPANQGELVFAVAQAPVNLDPRYATDAASERVNRLLYQPLVEFDAASRPVAGLADWHMLDARHYRFILKPDRAAFHDGQPLTATDVKATYTSLLALPDSPHRAEFAHIQRIETPSDDTIDFYLRKPDPHFAERLIIGILPARQLASRHDFSHAPVGSGSFRFQAWQHDLQFTRMADQMSLRIVEVKDPTVRVLKLKRGEVDMLQGDLPPELVRYLQQQAGILLQTGPGANYSYLGMNLRDPLLADQRIRQALAYAIDATAIIEQVMVAHSRPATVILPPEHYAGNPALQPYPHDPARARALLQAAGVRLPLRLSYKTSTDPQRVRLATILQAQMQEAGIALEIKSLDWGTFYADVQAGNAQLFGLTWVGIKTPEIYRKAFGSAYAPPQGFNRGGYRDAILDTLLAKEDWPAVTRRIHQQLPYLPLWYEGQFVACGPRLSGCQSSADGRWDALAHVTFKPQ